MIFPASFEQKLGFDAIRQLLRDYCLGSLGRENVDQIAFSTDPLEIGSALSQAAEMRAILEFSERFPAQDYYDMVPALVSIRIPGTYLEPEQLSELRLSLATIAALFEFLSERAEKYPCLKQLSEDYQMTDDIISTSAHQHISTSAHQHISTSAHQHISTSAHQHNSTSAHQHISTLKNPSSAIRHLVTSIDKLLDDKSEIRDSASAELKRIRKEKASKQTSVERKVIQSFRLARQSGWVPEDAEITVRNGRLVIPMISTHKRKIQGFVHDESATGQTVYVEPVEIFETNNEIRELEYDERREIVKILIGFAGILRPSIDPLIRTYRFLGKIDCIRAKARLAIETGGRKPMLIDNGQLIIDNQHISTSAHQHIGTSAHQHIGTSAHQHISTSAHRHISTFLLWRSAVHPLLFLSHTRQKKQVVPLDIELNSSQRILIISGPNAGGKSVCLKTVGLLQYMYQCGLLPPVKEDSEFRVFENIFIDIGDEQSIDNDLSTYTSKLYNLKYFIENSNENTLFLIDELGTGTDPSLGGAIAEATLEALNARKACGVVTTHYSNLKLLASREEGIANGAMLFDLKKLKPLYKLSAGKPGSSFALEIAREIGFPEGVLQAAQQKTGKSQLDFDRELQNLEVEKGEIEKKSTELRVADDFLDELITKYQKLTAELEKSKKDILSKAKQEAKEILDGSNKLIEKTIKEIREAQAEKEKTKEVRAVLAEEKKMLMQDAGSKMQDAGGKMQDDLEALHRHIGTSAHRHIGTSAHQHISTSAHQHISTSRSAFSGYLADLQAKHDGFRLTLDLRGKRVDEALSLLQRYIDDAILLSMGEVRILHGKGNGVLRQVTRDYLRSQKEVKSATDEKLEAGGTGITVVSLR